MNEPKVLILLAAYNGETHLPAQLDSLLAQDYPNIQIILSDDGSTDGSAQILDTYANQHPDFMQRYRSNQKFGCAQKHFMHLLINFHDAPYIMFCDQDDVWHPDKVSKTLAYMQTLERDQSVPAMVHTDLRVVDASLNLIDPSFCTHMALDGNRLAPNQLLVQNTVTGCAMMVNHALAALACRSEHTENMLMHDWWLAILASCCGVTGFLNRATIDYRQHSNNAVGAKNVRSAAYLSKRLHSQKMRHALTNAALQAESIYALYSDLLSADAKELLQAFAATKNQSLLKRNRIYLKYKLYKHGAMRNIAQFLGL